MKNTEQLQQCVSSAKKEDKEFLSTLPQDLLNKFEYPLKDQLEKLPLFIQKQFLAIDYRYQPVHEKLRALISRAFSTGNKNK